MLTTTLSIARRYCGPPRSGHGGYVSGRIAQAIQGPAVVRLKAPPPLEADLMLEGDGQQARLLHGDTLVGEARSTTVGIVSPSPPSFEEAASAAESYLGFVDHAFPRCFACGPQRGHGDGLRIFPGPVPGRDMVAAPWIPDESLADERGRVRPEFLWAALDCPSGFAVLPVPEDKAILMGEIAAEVLGEISVQEQCVAVGWPLQVDGRKRYAGAAVFDQKGGLAALARVVWLEVPRSAYSGF